MKFHFLFSIFFVMMQRGFGKDLQIDIHLKQCKLIHKHIRCDFRGISEDIILRPLAYTKTKETVFTSAEILNAQSVTIPDVICLNLTFKSIPKVDFKNKYSCDNDLTLDVKNSKILKIPQNLKRLKILSSKVDVIESPYIKNFQIRDSNIDKMKILTPLVGTTNEISNSVINILSTLRLNTNSKLLVSNTIFNEMESISLLVGKDAELALKNVTIKDGPNNSIFFENGSKFSQVNVIGDLPFIDKPDPTKMGEQQAISQANSEKEHASSYDEARNIFRNEEKLAIFMHISSCIIITILVLLIIYLVLVIKKVFKKIEEEQRIVRSLAFGTSPEDCNLSSLPPGDYKVLRQRV